MAKWYFGTPNARQDAVLRLRSRFQVSTAALVGNSHTAAARDPSVKLVAGAAPVSCENTAARAWNVDG